jgi:putative membrane protein
VTASDETSGDVGEEPGTEPHRRGGFAGAVLRGGDEPDPRFTLANERTFLAWIRTALALLAGGIAVEAFTPAIFLPETRTALAVLLLLLAMVVAVGAAVRWLKVERAMRRARPLPLPALIPVLALGAVLVAAAFAASILVRAG